jgi:preprotein translocase SecE subunit
VAKTIGKDKSSATRARASADTEDATMATRADEDPRDEDLPSGDHAAEDEEDLRLSDEAVSRAVANRPKVAAPTSRAPAVPDFLMRNPVTRFLAESYLELTKVTAPAPREAWNMTLIVIIFSIVLAAVLSLADLGLVRALTWIINIGH